MRKAVIDIGSNSILLLIAEKSDDDWISIYEDIREPRISEGLISTKIISDEPFKRALESLKELISITKHYNVDDIIIFGTAPFREAKNSAEIIKIIENETKQKLRVLSQDEEIYYSFLSSSTYFKSFENIVHIEIGGMTSELLIGNFKRILFNRLIPIGAYKLYDMFKLIPPIDNNSLTIATDFLKDNFNKTIDFENISSFPLIATGGTITTLACYISGDDKYISNKYHSMKISINKIDELLNLFSSKTIDEIKSLLVFAPKRADIITSGILIFKTFMELYNFKDLIVSERGVRWGIINL